MADKHYHAAKTKQRMTARPTKEQLEASAALCDALPSLLTLATNAGMPRTARALAEAVKNVGWERAEILTAEQQTRPTP